MDNTETKKAAYMRDWLTAFTKYRLEHQGQFPSTFDQANPFLESSSDTACDLSPDQFEVAYHGSWEALTKPNEAILLMERSALQGDDGTWVKMYGMADGSVVRKRGELQSFEYWETEHLIKPSGRD